VVCVSGQRTPGQSGTEADGIVVRRSGRGWRVGAEETADLLAAEAGADAAGPGRHENMCATMLELGQLNL
jgi:hypothetical protein